MSNEEAIANIVGLMTTFHLEIKALPDKLKCANCKSVLKNSYQMPCGCQFCRTCIDDVISSGGQFCPGGSKECGATLLSTAAPDYRANKSVLKLTAKCPHTGCPHECLLVDMESHMRACSRKNIDCPFRELGCAQGALPGEEMSCHFLQESRSHSEILIGMVTNVSRDMVMLKQELALKDEQARHLENEMKLIIDENKSIKNEMKSMKIENESIKDVNKSMKDELKSIKFENKSIKDVNKSIKIDIKSIEDEVKSMKIENKSIKQEKEVLCDRVRQLSEKLEQNSAMVTAITAAIASNRDEMEPVRNDVRSIRNQFDCMKRLVESIQADLGQLNDWMIEEDVTKTEWWGTVDANKNSGKFGLIYAFELSSRNSVSGGELRIYLRIWPGPSDPLLQWPFMGAVTVTVADKDKNVACSSLTLQCEIERPADNRYSASDTFEFPHAALRRAGLNLRRGVCVSCRILCPMRVSDTVFPRVTLSPDSSA